MLLVTLIAAHTDIFFFPPDLRGWLTIATTLSNVSIGLNWDVFRATRDRHRHYLNCAFEHLKPLLFCSVHLPGSKSTVHFMDRE